MSLKFLLNKKAEIIKSMDSIVSEAQEVGMFSEEQEEKFKSLKLDLAKVKSQIEMLQGYNPDEGEESKEEEKEEGANAKSVAAKAYSKNFIPGLSGKKEFESLADFMAAAITNPNDSRLAGLYKSEQSMGTGSKGGFLIPTQFIAEVKSVKESDALVRPRAQVIPAGTPPDAEISFPALDQEPNSSDQNQVFAGVVIEKVEEGGTKPLTDVNYRLITLKPSEMAARIPMTDKSLRNAPAIGTWAANLLRRATFAFEDVQFLRGNGVGGPKGVIDSGAAYAVARAVSNQIAFADIKALYSHFKGLESVARWVASYSAFQELLDLVGDGGGATNIIKVDQSTGNVSIYGIPVVRHDRVRALGSKGDLGLYDFSQYVIKDGSGPLVETGFASGQWEANKRSVKITWNVDGSPWTTQPYRDEQDFEVSPFVVLDVPAGS